MVQQPDANTSSYFPQAPVISVKDWIATLIVCAIPLVNLIMLFIWAFGDSANPSKKNYARASLLLAAIFIVLYILFIVIFIAVIGASGGFSPDSFFN
jgi:ABC-type multidrug transport system permease subunit